MRNALVTIFNEVWPMVLICCVILIVLRIAYMIKSKQKIIIHKEIFMLFFVIYMMCLFYVVTFQDIDTSASIGYNIVPFREMVRYPVGSNLFFKNVIGNMLMFIPFGFFTAYILRKTKLIWVVLITLIVSVTIELTQTQIGRIFDIDDVILNIFGGAFGYYLFAFIYRFRTK